MGNVSTAEAVQMLTEASGISGIRPENELGELGLSSIQIVEWLAMLEDKFGVEFNLQEVGMTVFTDHSVSDVLDVLRKQVADLQQNEEATTAE